MPVLRQDTGQLRPIGDRDHVQGHAAASVTLVEYGDYACRESGVAQAAVVHIQEQVGIRLKYVFRHFALSGAHAESQHAAEAAEAAGSQGRFWAMHRSLFAHQANLGNGFLLEYADALRLDVAQFLREMAAHLHSDRVREDFESGTAGGVRQTPAFFINGLRYEDAWSVEGLQLAVMEEAAAAESAS